MSNIKTSPNSALTICGNIKKVGGPPSLPAKPGSRFKPGRRNEASPAVSRSVTATAADHSHHSRLSILRKCCEGLSGCLMFLTGMLSAFVRPIDDHRFVPLVAPPLKASLLTYILPWGTDRECSLRDDREYVS